MEIVWIIAGTLFILTGIVGSFLPVIPGPPLSYVGLLLLQITSPSPFSGSFLIGWAIVVIIVSSLEHLMPAIGSNRMGGSKYGVWGCIIGAIFGLFLFPPFGFIIGPLVGAFAGEIIAGHDRDLAFRAAIGSFIGFFVSTLIKVVVSFVLAYYFFSAVFG